MIGFLIIDQPRDLYLGGLLKDLGEKMVCFLNDCTKFDQECH